MGLMGWAPLDCSICQRNRKGSNTEYLSYSYLRRAADRIGSYCLEIELRKIQAISDEVRAVIVKIIMLSHLGFHCFFVHVVGKTKPAKNTPKYFLALLPCSNQSPIVSRLRAHLRDWALVRLTVGRKSARVFVL